jgi:hypothetical protein
LAYDAASIDDHSAFEDWANEYGLSADSREAERIYRTTKRQTARLRRFLGDEYEEGADSCNLKS